MVNTQMAARSQRLSSVFHALADPTRRSILQSIAGDAKTVGELAAPFSISLAAVSKHLKVLERAGLIVREKTGSFQMISVNPAPMQQAHQWLSHYEQFWGERLDTLANSLAERKRKAK
jgi:DNA-binding transcriptional ArsR family regulator